MVNKMKNNIKIIFTGLVIFSSSIFALKPPSVGVLTKMIQSVEYKAAETEEWGDAELGSIMNNGDEVRTGNRSLAIIKFLDNSLLRLRENSLVTLYGTKVESKLNRNTSIEQGKVGFDVSKQEKEEFKFTTPTGVASIRGTKGFFYVPQDGSMLLYVREGLIDVESVVGEKQSGSVGAGQVAIVDLDGNVRVEDASSDIENDYESLMKDNIKRMRIILDTGEEYIIEYVE